MHAGTVQFVHSVHYQAAASLPCSRDMVEDERRMDALPLVVVLPPLQTAAATHQAGVQISRSSCLSAAVLDDPASDPSSSHLTHLHGDRAARTQPQEHTPQHLERAPGHRLLVLWQRLCGVLPQQRDLSQRTTNFNCIGLLILLCRPVVAWAAMAKPGTLVYQQCRPE
jgi:hypothetical protein